MIKKNMSIKKYGISSIKQLIDLNGSTVNFHLTFTVKSLSKEPFDALVVTQEMLDSNSPLNYQRAEGEISGQIKNDNNVYNSYFLCLKSDKPMEVEVTVNMNEVPAVVIAPVQTNADVVHPRTPMPYRQQVDNYEDDIIATKSQVLSTNDFYMRLAVVFGVCLLLGFGALYYYKYVKKQQGTAEAVVGEVVSSDTSLLKDGLSEISHKLNEITHKVSDGLSDVSTQVASQVTQNIHSEFDKLHHDMKPVTELGDIKDSIKNLQSLYQSSSSVKVPSTPPATPLAPPPPLIPVTPKLDTGAAMSNAEEVLARLNNMKILNKQA
jgi:hypothetical protein